MGATVVSSVYYRISLNIFDIQKESFINRVFVNTGHSFFAVPDNFCGLAEICGDNFHIGKLKKPPLLAVVLHLKLIDLEKD